MSTASQATHAADAARAIRHVDDGIGNWLKDLVTGAGSSPSHIIITGILGVVPGVGQVMDARDIILAVITISKTPAAVGGWVELVITLIGCVPAVGDSLKVGFKLMTKGHNFGRVLEAVSPTLRGNVEKYMRKVDWAAMTQECKGLFGKTIAAFIDGLDSWVVKAIGGRKEVQMVIEELQALQKSGSKMIDAAFAELKEMHSKMMGHQLAGSTAAVGATSSRAVKHEVPAAAATAAKKPVAQAQKKEAKVAAKKSQDVKGNSTPANTTKADKKKSGKPKKQKWGTGVPAEHLTDYFVKHKHIAFNKVNNNGKLTEEHSLPHNGLDHLWSNRPNLDKPFVVGETKSSIFDSLTLIAALPADLKEKFDTLRAEEAANPVRKDGPPNIFHSEGRDEHANKSIQVGTSKADEDVVRRGVNKPGVDKHGAPTGLATQMSHKWIARALASEQLTPEGRRARTLVERFINVGDDCPYQRWISLVTGRQLHKHQKSKGSHHEVQLVLHLPDNILED